MKRPIAPRLSSRIMWLAMITLFTFCSGYGQIRAKRAGDYYAFMSDSTYLTGFVFTEISLFNEGIAWVNKGELYGYVDTGLRQVTDYVYTDVSKFTNGFATVSRDSLFGFIDTSGKEICALNYIEVRGFNHGCAPVKKEAGWTIINTIGKVMFDSIYTYPPFIVSNRFIIVAKHGKWGVVNNKEQELYPFCYDLITADGVAYVGDKKIYLGLR